MVATAPQSMHSGCSLSHVALNVRHARVLPCLQLFGLSSHAGRHGQRRCVVSCLQCGQRRGMALAIAPAALVALAFDPAHEFTARRAVPVRAHLRRFFRMVWSSIQSVSHRSRVPIFAFRSGVAKPPTRMEWGAHVEAVLGCRKHPACIMLHDYRLCNNRKDGCRVHLRDILPFFDLRCSFRPPCFDAVPRPHIRWVRPEL